MHVMFVAHAIEVVAKYVSSRRTWVAPIIYNLTWGWCSCWWRPAGSGGRTCSCLCLDPCDAPSQTPPELLETWFVRMEVNERVNVTHACLKYWIQIRHIIYNISHLLMRFSISYRPIWIIWSLRDVPIIRATRALSSSIYQTQNKQICTKYTCCMTNDWIHLQGHCTKVVSVFSAVFVYGLCTCVMMVGRLVR